MGDYTVYKHTTPCGKVYIGITGRNPIKRWANGNGYINQPYFHNAIMKYGWENIHHEILYTGLTKEEACIKEIELIKEYNSVDKDHGYNISSGGEHPGRKAHVLPKPKTKHYHFIELNGEIHTITEWSKILDIDVGTIRNREKNGWDIIEGKPNATITCPICGKTVPKKKYKQKYCSPECGHAACRKQPTIATCKTCGKSFEVGRDRKGIYCSRECQHKGMIKR